MIGLVWLRSRQRGGIEGCVLVAQPGLDAPEKLKGKTLGTFQMGTVPLQVGSGGSRAVADLPR